jgi:hypothetical protein
MNSYWIKDATQKSHTKYLCTPDDDPGKGRNMQRRYQQQNKEYVDTIVSIVFVFWTYCCVDSLKIIFFYLYTCADQLFIEL